MYVGVSLSVCVIYTLLFTLFFGLRYRWAELQKDEIHALRLKTLKLLDQVRQSHMFFCTYI